MFFAARVTTCEKMRTFSHAALLTILTLVRNGVSAQDAELIRWTCQPEVANGETVIVMRANISPGWHIFSQHTSDGGPAPLRIAFDFPPGVVAIAPLYESGNATSYYDNVFEMDLTYYTGVLELKQKIRSVNSGGVIKVKLSYVICDEVTCIPTDREFAVQLLIVKK
jgi:thiol:disulfide interchange protein DsbD